MPKKTFALAALVLALALFASCQMPDYQLGFEITNTTVNTPANTVVVSYALSNIGYENLIDASIRIEVTTDTLETRVAWTTPVDINISQSQSGSYTFYFSGNPTSANAIVTGSAWDTENDSGWF